MQLKTYLGKWLKRGTRHLIAAALGAAILAAIAAVVVILLWLPPWLALAVIAPTASYWTGRLVIAGMERRQAILDPVGALIARNRRRREG